MCVFACLCVCVVCVCVRGWVQACACGCACVRTFQNLRIPRILARMVQVRDIIAQSESVVRITDSHYFHTTSTCTVWPSAR